MADPVGITGLIIGIPGLVTACADLYKLTVSARNFEHDVQVVVTRVESQQWRFSFWLQSVGFIEGVQPKIRLPAAVQPSVMKTLQMVQGWNKGPECGQYANARRYSLAT